MRRHEATQSAATRIREHQAALEAWFGVVYGGFGKHRDNTPKES